MLNLLCLVFPHEVKLHILWNLSHNEVLCCFPFQVSDARDQVIIYTVCKKENISKSHPLIDW